jgi:hypothetical protein
MLRPQYKSSPLWQPQISFHLLIFRCWGLRIPATNYCTKCITSEEQEQTTNLMHITSIIKMRGNKVNCCIQWIKWLNFHNSRVQLLGHTNYQRVRVEITNTMHKFAPMLCSLSWLLHVSALVCHLQGASGSAWVTWKYRSIWWFII